MSDILQTRAVQIWQDVQRHGPEVALRVIEKRLRLTRDEGITVGHAQAITHKDIIERETA